MTRLDQQFAFLAEAEKLKSVTRATPIHDASRPENSGEHSWSLALYALTLAEQAPEGVSIDRVIRMLLLHDLVEIDVGDVPIHSKGGTAHGAEDIQKAEAAAAERIFGLLPEDQGAQMLALWLEFEANESPDAIFAKSLDRVQPVLLNHQSGGGSWIEYDVSFPQLEERIGTKIARGAPAVWDWVRARVEGWFAARS
ncbi:putative hydrolase of HD superfamily [Thioclava sp. ES.031]|uniref:HD domain-containing protein n=1 Tax=Thioclava sp. ES.031 TaxID=1798203 RepID=UPI000BF6FA90|nr:HD domain-containing protein [Thioclava sp. ES.031]PFG63378.1 putative hydrolase of HD superfamily [Thioclava sp. ES.031]